MTPYPLGSCPNTNCLPAKNEIWSAKVANLVQHASEFGSVTSEVSVDMEAVRSRKRAMVDGLIEVHKNRYKATGAQLVMGSAKFVAPKTLEVLLLDTEDEIRIDADRVFLNLGTHASIPATPGLEDCDPLTHIELLDLSHLPQHLVVVGGGYVGLEFAQALRRFGSNVTILQHGAHLLSNQDHDVSDEIQRILVSEGIDVVTSAEIVSVTGRSGAEVKFTIRTPHGEREVIASDVLVATGRTPNTHPTMAEGLNSLFSGVKTTMVND